MDGTDLASLDGLTHAVAERDPGADVRGESFGQWDGTFCSHCGDKRRMELACLFWEDRWAPGAHRPHPTTSGYTPRADDDPLPALFCAICLQCQNPITLIVHPGPNGIQLIALPSVPGGLATANTPAGVAYYLDQAQRARSVGALSAAVAMYRSALEHLLHEQGYDQRTLMARIDALLKDEDPPPWKERLSSEYLTVIKDMGNAAIHVNDGDISQQSVFEVSLLREVQELFSELLMEVYELPIQKAERLSMLKAAVASVTR